MTFTRFMLGGIGILGWGLFLGVWYILMMLGNGSFSSGFTSAEWRMAIAPMAAFIFYFVIAIRPCHAITALSIGIVVHIPLVFMVIPFYVLHGPMGPVYALALLPGFVVWIAYVYQLSSHDKLISFSSREQPESRREALNIGQKLNIDQPWRMFRFIEVLKDSELKRAGQAWPLVDGWLLKAETISPGTQKALLEGDWIVTLPDGRRFKEVSFKTNHPKMEEALDVWSREEGRRWAKISGDDFLLSDGSRIPLDDVRSEHAQ